MCRGKGEGDLPAFGALSAVGAVTCRVEGGGGGAGRGTIAISQDQNLGSIKVANVAAVTTVRNFPDRPTVPDGITRVHHVRKRVSAACAGCLLVPCQPQPDSTRRNEALREVDLKGTREEGEREEAHRGDGPVGLLIAKLASIAG